MVTLSCIIVEDEPLAAERLQGYVQRLPFLQLLATFDNAGEARDWLGSHKADIVFMDINLGPVSGIDLLETTEVNSAVILTTAYPEYALKGYDLQVTDYLLKPFTFERFVQAVERARDKPAMQAEATAKTFLFVKSGTSLEKVEFDDILFIEGMRDYRRIHTLKKRIMTLLTFGELESEIPVSKVCRVHKSWMVAPGKIDRVEKDKIRIGETVIPISGTYKAGFYRLIER